jgi:hypothetical protein
MHIRVSLGGSITCTVQKRTLGGSKLTGQVNITKSGSTYSRQRKAYSMI